VGAEIVYGAVSAFFIFFSPRPGDCVTVDHPRPLRHERGPEKGDKSGAVTGESSKTFNLKEFLFERVL
jgi:hypothetical protein